MHENSLFYLMIIIFLIVQSVPTSDSALLNKIKVFDSIPRYIELELSPSTILLTAFVMLSNPYKT